MDSSVGRYSRDFGVVSCIMWLPSEAHTNVDDDVCEVEACDTDKRSAKGDERL